jgi:type II secretory pathway component GspD/PulD (secretin)
MTREDARRLRRWIHALAGAALLGCSLAPAEMAGALERVHRQVLIDAKFVEVAADDLSELGVGGPLPSVRAGGPELAALSVLRDLLAGESDARVLASPSVITLGGHAARLAVRGEVGDLQEVGLHLIVLPQVLMDGQIRIDLTLDVDRFAERAGRPVVVPRTAETQVSVPSGGTVLIGGLYDDDTRRAASRLPLLGDLPTLGALFASPGFQGGDRSLLVIVRPRLLHPDDGGSSVGPRVVPQVHRPKPDPSLQAPEVPNQPRPSQPDNPSHPYPRFE